MQPQSSATTVPQSSPAYRLRFWGNVRPQPAPAAILPFRRPVLQRQATCRACGQVLDGGECANTRCPEGWERVRRELGEAEASAVPFDGDGYYLSHDR